MNPLTYFYSCLKTEPQTAAETDTLNYLKLFKCICF
jgi:hypothetical protein